jgi:transposase-like protein
MKSLSCANKHRPPSGKGEVGAIIRHGFYTTRWGKRRRYQCQTCGKTFCSTNGTPYYRLQHRRARFDEVASLSVEGVNKSAIARVKGMAWNTVHRWLERAAVWCRRFSDRKIRRLTTVEAPGRRDQNDRRWQGTADLGLRRGRRLVSALAVNSGRQTKLPKHAVPFSRSCQPNESRTDSSGGHGWIRILRESHRTSVWTRMSLWPSPQDPQKRSDREGRAKNRAWGGVAIGTGVARLGGLGAAKHLVCRTAESDDPTGLSLSGSPNDLSSPVEGTSGRSPRVVPLLLQLHQTSQSTHIRT